MDLREVKIIQGKTCSGKTTKLLREYIVKSRKNSCGFISFEENIVERIPMEEISAYKNYIFVGHTSKKVDSLEMFIEKLNNFIVKNSLDYIFIDTPELGINNVIKFEHILIAIFKLKANVYITSQMKRDYQ